MRTPFALAEAELPPVRRHHVDPSVINRAIKVAAGVGALCGRVG